MQQPSRFPAGLGPADKRLQVSVIIPHYNDLEGLRLCYDRLLQQTWPATNFEIVVADNNSACGLEAVYAAAPNARVIVAKIQGAGPARNAAVVASRGAVLAFIDSDCIPEPRWIEEGMAVLAHYDVVGGQVVTLACDPAKPNGVEAFEIVFNFDFRRYIEEVGFSGTGNLFVPRVVFDRVGSFRPGVSEDVDWCFRARDLGYRIGYADRAVVGHPARRDWPQLQRRWERILAETYNLARARRAGRLTFLAKGLAMPLSIVPHAAKVLKSRRLPGSGTKWKAIGVLVRLRLWRTSRMLRLVAGL